MTQPILPKRYPPSERLAVEMMVAAERGATIPKEMIARALRGDYGDFTSDLETPKFTLVGELLLHGAEALASRVKEGEFDD